MIKFSELWLHKWLNYNKDINSLLKEITMLGFEVEKIEPLKENIIFDNLLVGEIIKFSLYQKKPKIFKLNILINNTKLLKIFSDINNLESKTKIILATKHSSLYKKYIKIPKYSFLLKSEGLLCSHKILNTYQNYFLKNSLIKLPLNSKNGENANKYLYINEKILHINIPTNRIDCLSILGFTRDLSVLDKIFFFKKPYNNFLIKDTKKYKIDIIINNNINNELYQYNYCIIKNIDLKKKIPQFIKNRLFQSGIEIISKNPLLNIYNYIILELGYPIQFYDLNKIKGKIYIENWKKNKYNFLNFEIQNIKSIISDDLLIIRDKHKILSIPGIRQNKDVIVTLTTKDILIECFYIKKKYFTSLFNKNHSFNDISNIYNRYLDPLIQKEVMIRTINLILEIFGGNRSKIYTININNINNLQKTIKFSFKNIYKILGFYILEKNIIKILNKLGFLIIKKTDNNCIITIPSWRNDINIEEDLIEEIIRVYGYNKIPNKIKIYLIKKNILKNESKLKQTKINLKKIKNILIYKGYYEVINYSFINPVIQSILYPKTKQIKIINPLTTETSVMRNSLSYGLINNIIYNQNRQQKNLRFFEYGLCFFKNLKKKMGISQKLMLSGIINGNLYSDYWNEKNKLINFYDIKGDIEYIFNFFNKYNKIEFRKQKNKNTIFHPYINSLIYINNINIGSVGMLHPKLMNYFNINYDTFLFEIFFEKITINDIFNFQKIIHYPINKRDISFFIKENIYYIDILSFLKKLKLKEIIKINLIDIYQGDNVPIGYKNITLSFLIQNKNYTLNEQEINQIINKCILELKRKFQILSRN
ncbi:phenylalanine--tRNA ligase subunit beta [Enterobacteriaceae endosymbiont of Donacia bicoloricornis]|uniref:phenylalanine--tRNA ligase subunit beta n=1 Tax=Enterobacteriaceae endosymbiont of Donacia bicoloricornis TaxID=2675772 RepID=UPI00144A222F|nr:phenylalanine--tRNA ligase subunit beta [Enterobacteriaceae endosymbiont of Donacia bicoloricornis]QJC37643.1 phenylalanine--tRNA ligase subunit beta [Enterobacteriaceae endosymbiont of Donacia bicoloricornis]